jgi:hypothetical protein
MLSVWFTNQIGITVLTNQAEQEKTISLKFSLATLYSTITPWLIWIFQITCDRSLPGMTSGGSVPA